MQNYEQTSGTSPQVTDQNIPTPESPVNKNQPSSDIPHIVIIGGGFGGLQAALHLGKAPARVTVIDRNNHHLFQPLLYQVATATLSPGEISAPIRHVLSRHKNTDVFMAEVTGIDTEQQLVLVHDQSMHEHAMLYDYLIIATGAH